MNLHFPTWLKKEMILRRPNAPPSRFLRMAGKIIGSLVLLLLCAFACWRGVLAHDINSRFAQIRASHLPTSGAELNDWRPRVTDAENGALVMSEAFSLIRNFSDKRTNRIVMDDPLLTRTNLWSREIRALVEEYVQMNASALAWASEALRFPRFAYPVDCSYGPAAEVPHLAKLKNLARIAALHSALEADEGRSDAWTRDVEFQLDLAQTLDTEPILISHMIRNALISGASRIAERDLNQAAPGEDACRNLQAAFARAGRTNLLPFALIGERAMMIPMFRFSWKELQSLAHDPDNGRPRPPQRFGGNPFFLLWVSGLLERDLDFFLKSMNESIDLAKLGPPESLVFTNFVEEASRVASEKGYLLSSLFLPVSWAAFREASTRARIELATTAAAVERFRIEQGRFPATLKDLTPRFLNSVPVDPFDGAPLRYRLLEKGYLIYSVDADGHDDDGRESPVPRKASDHSTYDITFVVER